MTSLRRGINAQDRAGELLHLVPTGQGRTFACVLSCGVLMGSPGSGPNPGFWPTLPVLLLTVSDGWQVFYFSQPGPAWFGLLEMLLL